MGWTVAVVRQVRLVALAVGLTIAAAPTWAYAASAATTSPASPAQFVLDGVHISITGGAVPVGTPFTVESAGSAGPSASATTHAPFRELSISAVPFATTDGADPVIGVAGLGKTASGRAALRTFRLSQGAKPLGSHTASLFGATVSGDASLVNLRLDSPRPVPTVVVEWVTQAGERLWIVRVAAELGSATASAMAGTLADVAVSAADVSTSTTIALSRSTAVGNHPATPVRQNAVSSQTIGLPFPSWWNGNCDAGTYAAGSQQQGGRAIAAYPLSAGASWLGLEACGPRPFYGEGPDVGARFPGTSWGVLEWECVELSMRYMYLAWGVHPYPANGKDVVWNYAATRAQYNPSGPALDAVSNDGNGPMPQPGDVLSFGATSSAGHTAIVTAISVDTSGNGSVTVLEENASANGWNTVPVNSWRLGGYAGGVSGWLHNPQFLPVPSNARAAMRAADGTTRTFYGLDSASPVFGGTWSYQGGGALGAPAVISVPTSRDHGSPLYLVTGLDHNLWVRSDAAAWRSLSPFAVYCTGPPGATVVAQTPGSPGPYVLVVGCRGADGALWTAQTPISTNPATLPSASVWSGLGGSMLDAPAIVPVAGSSTLQGELTFLVNGMDGHVWTRTDARQWTATPLACVSNLAAAAVVATTLLSTFACQGTDHAIWVSSNTGTGWRQAASLGSWTASGPGIVLSATSFTVVDEGLDNALWETTAATGNSDFGPWTSAGGTLTSGVAATALLPAGANP